MAMYQNYNSYGTVKVFLTHDSYGHMLPLKLNGKAYMGSPLMQLNVTLVTLKGLCQGHSGFNSLYLIKELS